jgi:tetratricopeptide (TPR) repeat protein
MTEITLYTPLYRILLLAGLLAILLAVGWFIVRTATGDRLIAVAQNNNEYDVPTRLASVDAAVQFAPQVPLLHYQRGQSYLAFASGEESDARLKEAIGTFRIAAQLSPEDYRIWVALGQALDRQGNTAEARKAFAQSLALAPNYYEPHWALANHLLRNNEPEAAFAEFKRALAIRPSELPLLFDYAWNAFNGDVPSIMKALDPSVQAKASFAAFLVQRDKFPEGIAMWREMSATTPRLARVNAQSFINTLIAKQHFAAAHEVWEATSKIKHPDEDKWADEDRQAQAQWFEINSPDAGSLLSNGDFEQDLKIGNLAPFTIWRLTPTKGLTISRNNQQHTSGSFSLQLNFDVGGNVGFAVLEQLIRIKPSTAYRLSFGARIEELTTLSAPLVEVYDPADIQRLRVMTKPFPLGTSAWQEYSVNFTTAAATEAVMVRVLRPACGEPPCPIRGKIWLDNFKLSPAN